MAIRVSSAVFGIVLAVFTASEAFANGLLVSRSPRDARTTRGDAVSLVSHRVEARLKERVLDVKVEQVFRNSTRRQLEGVYLFPLPEGAIVSDFAMTMGGKLVKGEIMDASKARGIYESIVRRRRDPGLLEYVGRGLFRANVFPIPARGDVTVQIGFQQIVPEDDGTLEVRYPLATARFHSSAVETVVVDVQIEGAAPLRTLFSPSHDVEIVRSGKTKARVSYEGSGRRQLRDFLMYVGRSDADVAVSLLSHKQVAEDGTFLAVFAPPVKVKHEELPPKDVIYVLDTSGSMNKEGKIDQARRALQSGIGMLRTGDRFNVVAFSSSPRVFRESLVEVSADTRRVAHRWIGELQAKGGTDIGHAMQTAVSMGKADRVLFVVLITDGKPTVGLRRRDLLTKHVKTWNEANARIFTFGVGYDLDVALLDEIAEDSRGAREYVEPGQDLEIVTSRFFTKVNHPALTDVTIDFGPGVTDVYPRGPFDLFVGSQLTLMGRFQTAGDRKVIVKGKSGDATVVRGYNAKLQANEDADYLPRLWASRKVAFLLDQVRLHGQSKEVVDEIITLATRHGIVTPYTSGLVVEEGEFDPRGGVQSAAPLSIFDRGGRRRPRGAIPPGMREPSDPTPAPPAPPTTPSTPTVPPPTTPSIPQTGPMSPGPSMPTSPTPAAPRRDARGDVGVSKDLDAWKRRVSGGQAALEHKYVKALAGKTFIRRYGVWVDSTYEPKAKLPEKRVEAYSDAWMKLVKGDAKLAKFFSVGERVAVVWKGTVYIVMPPK